MKFISLFMAVLLSGCAGFMEGVDFTAYEDLKVRERTNPRYPKVAVENGLSGYVEMTFNVTSQGDVTNVVVVNSFPKGLFDEVAVRALAQWKYEPFESVESVPQQIRFDFKANSK
ncbi:energy transducer TonB [Vibrio fortis]|uniref:energy transducer TonB n=1 Tax=Vibrio fortis TaxID=212667 RepID=UPI002F3F3C04